MTAISFFKDPFQGILDRSHSMDPKAALREWEIIKKPGSNGVDSKMTCLCGNHMPVGALYFENSETDCKILLEPACIEQIQSNKIEGTAFAKALFLYKMTAQERAKTRPN